MEGKGSRAQVLTGSGLIIDSQSRDKLHPILDIFSWQKAANSLASCSLDVDVGKRGSNHMLPGGAYG